MKTILKYASLGLFSSVMLAGMTEARADNSSQLTMLPPTPLSQLREHVPNGKPCLPPSGVYQFLLYSNSTTANTSAINCNDYMVLDNLGNIQVSSGTIYLGPQNINSTNYELTLSPGEIFNPYGNLQLNPGATGSSGGQSGSGAPGGSTVYIGATPTTGTGGSTVPPTTVENLYVSNGSTTLVGGATIVGGTTFEGSTTYTSINNTNDYLTINNNKISNFYNGNIYLDPGAGTSTTPSTPTAAPAGGTVYVGGGGPSNPTSGAGTINLDIPNGSLTVGGPGASTVASTGATGVSTTTGASAIVITGAVTTGALSPALTQPSNEVSSGSDLILQPGGGTTHPTTGPFVSIGDGSGLTSLTIPDGSFCLNGKCITSLASIDGQNGQNGQNGANGVSITGASVSSSNNLTLNLSNGGVINAGTINVPQGSGGSANSTVTCNQGDVMFGTNQSASLPGCTDALSTNGNGNLAASGEIDANGWIVSGGALVANKGLIIGANVTVNGITNAPTGPTSAETWIDANGNMNFGTHAFIENNGAANFGDSTLSVTGGLVTIGSANIITFNGTDGTSYFGGLIGAAAGCNGCGAPSDARLKKDITPVTEGLAAIDKLKPVYFNYLPPSERTLGKALDLPVDKRQVGFIAQDVEKVIPEATFIAKSTDTYVLDQSKIVPMLVKAVQELKADNDNLHKEIEQLKAGQKP